MEGLVHVVVFLFASTVIWFFAGTLIEAIERVARHFNKSGFTVAFFVLGLLTSISEISVATNATLEGVPGVSVGNLIGASLVILLFLIPFLAVISKGLQLRHILSPLNLQLALVAILIPVLFVVDGNVHRREGLLSLLVYITLLIAIRGQKDSLKEVKDIEEGLLERRKGTAGDILKILLGGTFIFVAGHFLVEQAVYFAGVLSVPGSLIGLILLSLGTNVPELVIAARSVFKKRKDIAFGDYVGSAAANTAIFGVLALSNGRFTVEASEFIFTGILMAAGLILFYLFARSKRELSRKEGLVLLGFYLTFLGVQIYNVIRFSGE